MASSGGANAWLAAATASLECQRAAGSPDASGLDWTDGLFTQDRHPDMDASGLEYKTFSALAEVFRSALTAAVQVAHVVSADELQVYSCRNPHTSFGVLENAGDNFLSEEGPHIVLPLLHEHFSKGRRDAPSEAAMEAWSCEVSGDLHANVGLGPFFAELFDLRHIFTNRMSQCSMNPEVAAGLLEAILGGVERAGLQSLWQGFVQFGYTVLMAMAYQRHQRRDARHVLVSISSQAVGLCEEYGARLQLSFQSALWDRFHDELGAMPLIMASLHADLFKRLFTPSLQCGPMAPVEIVHSRERTRREVHPTARGHVRYVLYCVDCDECFVTDYVESDWEALAQARAQGWGKASSSSWKSSSRCPQNHDRW